MNELKKLALAVWLKLTFGMLRMCLPFLRHPKLRAMIMRQTSGLLSDALTKFDAPHSIEVHNQNRAPTGVAMSDGKIRLSTAGTDRYFKQTGDGEFEGYQLAETLRQFGISKPATIIDIGANFGEISLCFAALYPKARIVAVEPSSANLEILEANLASQEFDTSNIEVLKFAAADDEGPVKITRGLGAQNSIVAKRGMAAHRYEEVQTLSLDQLFKQASIKRCDFIKIDIEGAEPGLKASLAKVLPKTRSLFIEFTYKNTPEAYAELVDVFIQSKDRWVCSASGTPGEDIPLNKIIDHFVAVGGTRKGGAEYWFVKQD